MASPKESVFGFAPRYADDDAGPEPVQADRQTAEAQPMLTQLEKLVEAGRKGSAITKDCRRLSVHIPDSQYKKLRHFCAEHAVTLQGLVALGLQQVESAIEEYETEFER